MTATSEKTRAQRTQPKLIIDNGNNSARTNIKLPNRYYAHSGQSLIMQMTRSAYKDCYISISFYKSGSNTSNQFLASANDSRCMEPRRSRERRGKQLKNNRTPTRIGRIPIFFSLFTLTNHPMALLSNLPPPIPP